MGSPRNYDYWNPQRGGTADDHLVLKALEESIGFACRKPTIGSFLPESLARLVASEPRLSPLPAARPSHPREALVEALFEHVERLLSRARRIGLTSSAELQSALLCSNGGMAGVDSALSRAEAGAAAVARRRAAQLEVGVLAWSGRELAGSCAAALEYRRQREVPYGDLTWMPHRLDWELREGEAIAWTVRELTSSRALAEETRAMHHCVASYAHRCVQGTTAIVSLCADGVRRVTVELDPFRRRIVQVRGLCNRAALPAEDAVLAEWLAATAPADGDSAVAARRGTRAP